MTAGEDVEWSARLRKLHPSELSVEQRNVYDAIVSGRRSVGAGARYLLDEAGRLEGPFNAMLLNPRVGEALQALGAALRYESSFGGRAREVAVLEVARHCRCEYEWLVHEQVGAAEGLSGEELQAVRCGRRAGSLSELECCVRDVVRELLEKQDLGERSFLKAQEALGLPGLQELVTLVGYYELLALFLRVWRVDLPNDRGKAGGASERQQRPGAGIGSDGRAPSS